IEVREPGRPARDEEEDDTTTLMATRRPGRAGANLLMATAPPPDERTVVAMNPRTGSMPAVNLSTLRPSTATLVDAERGPARRGVAETAGAGRPVNGPPTGAGDEPPPADRTVVCRQGSHGAGVGSSRTRVSPPAESTMVLSGGTIPRQESTMILSDGAGRQE